MYILDTDICIYTIKRKPAQVLERFTGIEVGEVGISAITLAELVFGARKSRYFEKNIKALEKFTLSLEILEYDMKAAYTYGRIRKQLEAAGTPIGPMDTLIAAHALSRHDILVTNNEREFKRVAGLQVENWVS